MHRTAIKMVIEKFYHGPGSQSEECEDITLTPNEQCNTTKRLNAITVITISWPNKPIKDGFGVGAV